MDQTETDAPDPTPRQLFDTYLNKPGQTIKVYDDFAFKIIHVNPEKLYIEAVIVHTDEKRPCWFHKGEIVVVKHLGGAIYRMTSEHEDHGQAVFLGEDYGGLGVGS